jgi:hypothetical protein
VSAAISRENEVHKLLTGERILGLDLLRGRKVGGKPKERTGALVVEDTSKQRDARVAARSPLPDPAEVDEGKKEGRVAPEEESSSETAGLPLFGGDGVEGG